MPKKCLQIFLLVDGRTRSGSAQIVMDPVPVGLKLPDPGHWLELGERLVVVIAYMLKGLKALQD
jgi:hypothetical protein